MNLKGRNYGLKSARAKLQRLCDGKVLAGWVCELDERYAVLDLEEAREVLPDQLFAAEVCGIDKTAILKGKVDIVSETICRLNLFEAIKFVTPKEKARFRVDHLSATFGVMGFGCDVTVVDIAQDGLGAICPFPVDEGTMLDISISYETTSLQCKGEIQYCHSDPGEQGSFRAGVLLAEMGRLDAARWLKLIESVSSAA